MDMDPAPLFAQASEYAAGIIANVEIDQLGDPTPCIDWDLKTLLNHLIGANQFFAGKGDGTWVDPPEGFEPPDFVGDDPSGAYEASVQKVEAAYSPEMYGNTVTVQTGDMPAGQLYAIGMSEQLLHGWDIARATGQDGTMDDALASAVDAMLRPNIDAAVAGGFYGPSVPVADDASPTDKLVALVGRRP